MKKICYDTSKRKHCLQPVLKGKRLAAGTGTGLLNDTLKEVFK